MLRTTASRALVRSLQRTSVQSTRATFNGNLQRIQWTSKLCTSTATRPSLTPAAPLRPLTTALVRFQSSKPPYDKIDKKAEAKLAHQSLKPTPETVSTTSSVHPIVGEVGGSGEHAQDTDMMAGIRQDIDTVRDTFNLKDVPHQAYVIGLAGVLPYLATSLSTVYCSWEIGHAAQTGGYIMSESSARLLLEFLEPLQVGYGAVILSFLGAIHWGLEWAGFGGQHGYKRYAIGVIAPAIAWPTILFPPVYALITQFAAFVSLYYVDARATVRGWTPQWYGMYRFVLTFIVGASIVVSLVGRGQIAERAHKLPSPAERLLALRNNAALEISEEAKATVEDEKAQAEREQREQEEAEKEKEEKENQDKEEDDKGEDKKADKDKK